MKILITGANGLVGHSIQESPIKETHVLLTPSHSELDLLDYKAVLRYLDKTKPDFVVHAAGIVGGIAANIKNPVRFLLNNMDMGRNIIYGAYEAGVKNFINLGSSCMYPRDCDKALTEDMILKGELEPTNEGYALAKVMCERLCEYIGREHPEYQYKTLIPCNLYGRWDKFQTESAHMIPAVIHKIHMAQINQQKSIEVWGSGNARREFMYSGDLAECITYSIDHFNDLPVAMNVGLGYDYTVNEYYETIAEVIGYQGEFLHDLSKPEGMKRKLTDVSKQRAFGWMPKIDLKSGIEKTYDFYLSTLRIEG